MREARVERQGGHRAAALGDAAPGEGAEVRQKRLRLGEGGRVGRGEEGEIGGCGAPLGQGEGEGGEVGARDLGRGEGGHRALGAARPGAKAHPGLGAPGAAAALVGLGAARRLGDEARHAGARVVARAPGAAAVHDDAHALNRQRGLGDGGGEDELAARGGGDGGALRGGRHGAEQRHHLGAAAFEPRGDAADLPLAGQEGEGAAPFLGQRAADEVGHAGLELAQGGGEPARLDGMGAPLGRDHGRADQIGHRPRIQRRGHDEERQIPAQLGHLQRQGEREVGVHRALVELVQDEVRDARQIRVALEAPDEEPFGDDLDPRRLRDARLAAHPVADRAPHRLAQGSRPCARRPRARRGGAAPA